MWLARVVIGASRARCDTMRPSAGVVCVTIARAAATNEENGAESEGWGGGT